VRRLPVGGGLVKGGGVVDRIGDVDPGLRLSLEADGEASSSALGTCWGRKPSIDHRIQRSLTEATARRRFPEDLTV